MRWDMIHCCHDLKSLKAVILFPARTGLDQFPHKTCPESNFVIPPSPACCPPLV